MIDRPAPGQGPTPEPEPEWTPPDDAPPARTPAARTPSRQAPPVETPPTGRGRYIGPLRITPAVVLVALAIVGSLAFILYVVFRVEDEQIPLLAAGFGVLGACFAVIAIGSVFGMWHAASRARTGRAFGLAIAGGIAGLIAIGCFTFTALATMVWRS